MANLNLNNVVLGGRVTANIELKQTTNGTPVCTFSLAINRRGGEEADFFNCVAWKSTAEFISRYFKKGSSLCVIGRLENRSWTDNRGQKRYVTEVIVERAYFVDNKSDGAEPIPEYASTGGVSFEEVNVDEDLPF